MFNLFYRFRKCSVRLDTDPNLSGKIGNPENVVAIEKKNPVPLSLILSLNLPFKDSYQ